MMGFLMIIRLNVTLDVDAVQWAKNHEHNGSPIEWDEDIPESVAMTVFNTRLRINLKLAYR